jgi:ferredoxin
MILASRELLIERGAKSTQVHLELFHAETSAVAVVDEATFTPVTVSATVNGQLASAQNLPSESVLETLLRNGVDAPYSCMGGACGTCKAKLVRGTGDPGLNFALTDEEVEQGYVLTCQTRPTSSHFTVDYDA